MAKFSASFLEVSDIVTTNGYTCKVCSWVFTVSIICWDMFTVGVMWNSESMFCSIDVNPKIQTFDGQLTLPSCLCCLHTEIPCWYHYWLIFSHWCCEHIYRVSPNISFKCIEHCAWLENSFWTLMSIFSNMIYAQAWAHILQSTGLLNEFHGLLPQAGIGLINWIS